MGEEIFGKKNEDEEYFSIILLHNSKKSSNFAARKRQLGEFKRAYTIAEAEFGNVT